MSRTHPKTANSTAVRVMKPGKPVSQRLYRTLCVLAPLLEGVRSVLLSSVVRSWLDVAQLWKVPTSAFFNLEMMHHMLDVPNLN